jgi:hypothetical protein
VARDCKCDQYAEKWNSVGFEVITAVIMKVASHMLALWFLARLIFEPENGGDTFLENVSSCTDYTASYPRRWHLSNGILEIIMVGRIM